MKEADTQTGPISDTSLLTNVHLRGVSLVGRLITSTRPAAGIIP
jgi:hypothetical protein